MAGLYRFTLIVGAALAMLATPGPAAAGALIPFQPWTLDYAENQCSASRGYGQASDPVILAIRPAPNGATYELLVGKGHAGPKYAEELKGRVDFGRGPIKAWLLHYGGSRPRNVDIFAYRIGAEAMDQARSTSSVTVIAKDTIGVTFQLDHMPELLAGLERCTEDLKHYWNMDWQQTGRIATPAKGEVRSIFSSEDYPSEALMGNKEGTSQFLLLIDEKGSVAGCHVERPSGIPVLDAMGCQVILKRAKFRPARDAHGQPVRSSYTTPPISWRLAV